jgi:glycosyltransferase involved in cell wall biosynthesis
MCGRFFNDNAMKILVISDAFPPMNTSGAIQIRDLTNEFKSQDHNVTVILPISDIKIPFLMIEKEGIQILQLRVPKFKDVSYLRRAIAELIMPFAMLRNLRKSPLKNQTWCGIVWYSPSIFFGPLVKVLKKESNCRAYLIVRDIFPQWAVDLKLISRWGPTYQFFNFIANFQYSVANVIGVQSDGNLLFFEKWSKKGIPRIEVLQNWLAENKNKKTLCTINNTTLHGRKIFIYAGNMGIAQNVESLLDLAGLLNVRHDIGFLFIGRGSNFEKLARDAMLRGLNNVIFHNEISSDDISELCEQSHVGLIALDSRHRSHNIPGKFLTYMRSGLPVLANINKGNDLCNVIKENSVGLVCTDNQTNTLARLSSELIDLIDQDKDIRNRCRTLYLEMYSPTKAVKQIVRGLA